MAKGKNKGEIRISPDQLLSLYQNQRSAMDSILQRERAMRATIEEITGAEEALKEIRDMGKGVNSLFLLGSGVFIEARLDKSKVKSEVGGGIVKEVSIKEALAQLSKKKKNAEKSLSMLLSKKRELAMGLSRMEAMLKQVQQALEQKRHSTKSVS